MKENSYRPLPEGLYIGNSNIEGNGLFTKIELKEGEELGITHIRYNSDDFHSNYIRTPLGGFVNHSTTPNCKTFYEGRLISIITITDIKAGDEITLKYNMYDPSR